MPLAIRFVDLPPTGQAGPIFVSRYEHAPSHHDHQNHTTFFNHDHTVLVLHQGDPCVVEQAVGLDTTSWTLERGDVLVIPAGAPHRRRDLAGAFVATAFCAACLDLDDVVTAPLDRIRAGASPVVRIPPDRQAHMSHLFDELLAATTNPAVPLIVTKSLLIVVLHELARTQLDTSQTGDTLLADALRFIERHCLGPLTLGDVARHVRRSPSHLATLIKKATGQTILGWITTHRMAEARRRLRHSDEQIDVIAERVGYADPTHFIRVFRRHHGQTPAAWRRYGPA